MIFHLSCVGPLYSAHILGRCRFFVLLFCFRTISRHVSESLTGVAPHRSFRVTAIDTGHRFRARSGIVSQVATFITSYIRIRRGRWRSCSHYCPVCLGRRCVNRRFVFVDIFQHFTDFVASVIYTLYTRGLRVTCRLIRIRVIWTMTINSVNRSVYLMVLIIVDL